MAGGRGDQSIDTLLGRLPRLSMVVGKGGVGKTTCAVGIASRLAARGTRTLLVSTDPAGSLGSVLGLAVTGGECRSVDGAPRLSVLQLDARRARSEFLARWRDTIVSIVDRGTYLDLEDIGGLVDAVMPGADEIFALLALAELSAVRDDPAGELRWQRLVVDTAPTGHTLRLLALPETFEAMIALLDAMQGKHRFMVSALTRRYRPDRADEFLAEMRSTIGAFRSSLGDESRAATVLVTRAERIVVTETVRYAAALRGLGIAMAGVIVNAVTTPMDSESRSALVELRDALRGNQCFALPRSRVPPVGLAEVEELISGLTRCEEKGRGGKKIRAGETGLRDGHGAAVSWFSGGAPHVPEKKATRASTPHCDIRPLIRTVTVVGGKGGVGKTTVSCALALTASTAPEMTGDVLLLSTDPAPSIGDALGVDTPQWARRAPERVDHVPNLLVWQLDATTAFQEFRERYTSRIDALFDAWIGRGVDASHDRLILRDLLALSPPGIDEVYALTSIAEAFQEDRYTNIIIDPAPTGHLLRLLEMPALALDWSHRLMRLILKYREIADLAEPAQELLEFSRRTRVLDRVLRDPTHAGVVVVSLDEPVVLAESARLVRALAEAAIPAIGMVLNRAAEVPLELEWSGILYLAPTAERPLVTPQAIGDWCRRWQQRD